MAVDEALLDRARPGDPPVLRLYRWTPGAVSLGRAQRRAATVDPARLRDAMGLELVRRPTGGLAVLHEREVTYAVVAGPDAAGAAFRGGVEATYRSIARALAAGLARLGLEVDPLECALPGAAPSPRGADGASCFDRRTPSEIAWRGRKLVGSAQRRRRGAFLQHGSLPLALDPARLAAALGEPVRADAFVDLAAALGREPAAEEVQRALAEGFGATRAGGLRPDEVQRATELYSWKYVSLDWTLDGGSGARERRVGPPWET